MPKRSLTAKEMCEIQDELNEYTLQNWKTKLNTNHFVVAIMDEISEFLGSVNWKWWAKRKEPNFWNLKIEAIDILHFALSIIILREIDKECTYLTFCYGNNRKNILVNVDGSLNHDEFAACSVVLMMNSKLYQQQVNDFLNCAGFTEEEVSALYIAKAELNRIRQSSGYKTGEYVKVVDGKEDNERLEEIVNHFLLKPDMDLDEVSVMVRKEFFKNV